MRNTFGFSTYEDLFKKFTSFFQNSMNFTANMLVLTN